MPRKLDFAIHFTKGDGVGCSRPRNWLIYVTDNMKVGISTWVWLAPLTTADLTTLAPRIARMGFDMIEIPIEGTQDIDYRQAAQIVRDNGLAVTVAVAMGADRDLISPDARLREQGLAYLRHCIEATQI